MCCVIHIEGDREPSWVQFVLALSSPLPADRLVDYFDFVDVYIERQLQPITGDGFDSVDIGVLV